MKKVLLLLFITSLLMAFCAYAVKVDYLATSPEGSDIVFDYVSIGMIGPGPHEEPFDANGLYIGYDKVANDYQELGWTELPGSFSRYNGQMEMSLPYAYASNSFFIELWDGFDLVAYSDLADYDTLIHAIPGEGWRTWTPVMYSATAPEPSSGLLLLMGGALLGLRRKRRVA